ncbi:DUF4377 domain-containing protein [Chitinophaga sp. SYP-B3965]|uniref:DUF4377 domain-containing protein n=1 Tax=Chitinophaga sp. SYP-B3965 TaxID=2663120 RepID=UPI00129A09C1|nr:DUF4377 domain-containing protein [Chitinophaga sp. SYP-B3965]MRG46539.1 DUF4377 domain-containing protein [Chitinophaga sp. SYP-B3965]
MKRLFLIACIGTLGFAACQNAPKSAASADSVEVTSSPEGYYEASLAAASSPGRLIGLTLKSTNDAEMITDYLNSTPEIIQMGNWIAQDSNKYLITLVTVGSGNPEKDSLTFKQDGDRLLYIGADYGSDGLSLVKKEKPAATTKELIIWVKSEAECDRGPGFGKTKCYEVVYGDKLLPDAKWDNLSAPIDSFTFEKGNLYKLKVNRIPRDPLIQDVGAWEYKLAEVLSKKKVK